MQFISLLEKHISVFDWSIDSFSSHLLFSNSKQTGIYEYDTSKNALVLRMKTHMPISKTFTTVAVYKNYQIMQDFEAVVQGDSHLNKILIWDSVSNAIVRSYPYDILLSSWHEEQYFFSFIYKGENIHYCLFNPFNQTQKWELILPKEFRLKVILNCPIFLLVNEQNGLLNAYCKSTGQWYWQANITTFRTGNYGIAENHYNVKTGQLIIVFYDRKAFSIKIQTGIIQWYVQNISILNTVIDPETGEVWFKTREPITKGNIFETFAVDELGKISLKVAFNPEQIRLQSYCADYSWQDLVGYERLIGVHGDYLYYTLDMYGLLYKIHKYTHFLEMIYHHNHPFDGASRTVFFHQERLFLADLSDFDALYNEQNRLLIFKL